MSATTYTSPVDKLLTLGKAELVDSDKWPNYLELGLGPEHIPDLIRMATDRELRGLEPEEGEEEKPEFWAPVHALRALGQLHAEAAAEPLVNKFSEVEHDHWVQEELPQIFVLIGSAAIPSLTAHLTDSSHEIYTRAFAAESLEAIGKKYPESRSECISVISKQLEEFEENDYELNAFLIANLSHLKAVETLPLIERVFEADRVDESVINLDSVLVNFGLKEREEIPTPFAFGNFFEKLEKRGSPLRPDQITIVPPSDTPDNQPPYQQARPSTYQTTDKIIKFSGKKVTKKKSKKKR
jgi:HEAT repeat protein